MTLLNAICVVFIGEGMRFDFCFDINIFYQIISDMYVMISSNLLSIIPPCSVGSLAYRRSFLADSHVSIK